MKQGLTLEELSTEILRQRKAKTDFVATTHKLHLRPEDDGLRLFIDEHGPYGITDNAHNQIADRMAIPHKYYQRMLHKAPSLLAENVNHWFQAEPDKRMLRTLDGQLRAYLSNRYRPLDHHDLANTVLPLLLSAGATIHSCHITPSKLYIKGVVEHVHETIPPPENHPQQTPVTVSPGIVIANSETGEASLTIQPAVHFLKCTNLATWAQHHLRRRHIGRFLTDTGDDDTQEFTSDRTKALTDAALWSKVSDITGSALEASVFTTIVEELRAARQQDITPGGVTAAVEKLSNRSALPDTEQSGILEYLMQGGDFTKFGLSNAVTRYSQDVDNYERATYLEQLGGDIITLPQHDWLSIAA